VRVAASFSTLFINVSIKLKHGIIIPLITTITTNSTPITKTPPNKETRLPEYKRLYNRLLW